MKYSVLIWFVLISTSAMSQKILTGKVETGGVVSDILVVNLTQEIQTQTDDFGVFFISANEGDLLIFSSIFIKRKRFLVEKEHFESNLIIPIEQQQMEIEAVEIIRSNITSESLGLVPEGQKRYTPAERRLKTATDMELLLGFGVGFSLDPILNAISGRIKMLKKELEIERFNKNVILTESYISDDLLISKFDIPADYTKSFRMFLVENPDFMKVMETQDKDNIVSKAFSLSEVFQKIIIDEQ